MGDSHPLARRRDHQLIVQPLPRGDVYLSGIPRLQLSEHSPRLKPNRARVVIHVSGSVALGGTDLLPCAAVQGKVRPKCGPHEFHIANRDLTVSSPMGAASQSVTPNLAGAAGSVMQVAQLAGNTQAIANQLQLQAMSRQQLAQTGVAQALRSIAGLRR